MLKQSPLRQIVVNAGAAASVRLCVETLNEFKNLLMLDAAASVRLCVETTKNCSAPSSVLAAASVRLCVETSLGYFKNMTL